MIFSGAKVNDAGQLVYGDGLGNSELSQRGEGDDAQSVLQLTILVGIHHHNLYWTATPTDKPVNCTVDVDSVNNLLTIVWDNPNRNFDTGWSILFARN